MNEIQNTIKYLKKWVIDLSQFEDEKEAVYHLQVAIRALERQEAQQ